MPRVQPSFESFGLIPELKQVIAEIGFTQPTPVQVQVLPLLQSGRDVIAQSKTGSGKTLAFAIPLLQKLELKKREVQALVLCPTRELCTQVTREIRKLGRRLPGLQVTPVTGGQPSFSQIRAIQQGAQIIVGTPGRVLDLVLREKLDLRKLKTLILDEADRMLDMGFEEEMNEILSRVPEKRQTGLFSATFPKSIEKLSARVQQNPAHVVVEDTGAEEIAISERVVFVERVKKTSVLMEILKNNSHQSTLIFVNLKTTAADLQGQLKKNKFSALALFGDLDQQERDRATALFRNGTCRVLVATDVAARGLDIQGLECVINYDFPRQPEVYVHRIGRTGRAGKTGEAWSFVEPEDRRFFKAVEEARPGKLEVREVGTARGPATLDSEKIPSAVSAMRTLSIFGGRKDKLRPGDILGALTGGSEPLEAKDIGKIEILDRISYVAISSECIDRAFKKLSEERIKAKRFRIKLEK